MIATYDHYQNPGTAQGTLLTINTVSDEDGFFNGRVRYADDPNLVGNKDRVTITTT